MNTVDLVVEKIIEYLQTYGVAFGMILIVLESIIPVLPLGVFVAFNMMAYGVFIGFVISYIATICGCLISYTFSKKIHLYFYQKRKKKKVLDKLIDRMQKISFSLLVVIIALPFSPAFLINIAAGISNISKKKFLCALFIGKISIIYFWGFVSKSLLESITDFKTIITIFFLLFFSFLLSKLVNKKLNLE